MRTLDKLVNHEEVTWTPSTSRIGLVQCVHIQSPLELEKPGTSLKQWCFYLMSHLLIFLFLKKILCSFYLFEWHRNKERQTFPIPWITLKMPTRARDRSGAQNSVWVYLAGGGSYPNITTYQLCDSEWHLLLPLRVHVSRKPESGDK